MKKIIFVLLAFLFHYNTAKACYNKYCIYKGEVKYWATGGALSDEMIYGWWGSQDSLSKEALREAKKRYEKDAILENYSDYAVALCYTGEYNTALKILHSIEKKCQTSIKPPQILALLTNYSDD